MAKKTIEQLKIVQDAIQVLCSWNLHIIFSSLALQSIYDFFMTIGRAETVVPNYQIKWNSIIQEEVLLLNLPQYLRDEISVEELVEKMNQAAVRFNYERGIGD